MKATTQPARLAGAKFASDAQETIAHARKRDKRRRARDLAKAARKKNR